MPDQERKIISLEEQARVDNQPLASTQAEAQLFSVIDRAMGVEHQTRDEEVTREADESHRTQIEYIRELNSIELELRNADSATRAILEARRDELKTELESMVATEKEKERYLDAGLRLFTRLQTQKDAILANLKAFKGLTPNRNELMNPLNAFVDKIETLRKEGDPNTPERREGELKAAALEFELRKTREEVLAAIENYNPIESLWLDVLRELELAEDERISKRIPQITKLRQTYVETIFQLSKSGTTKLEEAAAEYGDYCGQHYRTIKDLYDAWGKPLPPGLQGGVSAKVWSQTWGRYWSKFPLVTNWTSRGCISSTSDSNDTSETCVPGRDLLIGVPSVARLAALSQILQQVTLQQDAIKESIEFNPEPAEPEGREGPGEEYILSLIHI